MQDPLRLSELMCARLCHDLSGPLGSLMSVAEFAPGDPNDAEAVAVAAQAAAVLAGRLRLLRAAWAGDPMAMGAGQLQQLAEGFAAGGRVEVDLSGVDGDAPFAPAEARVVLNLVLLGVEALAGAGRLVMAGAAGGDVIVTITGPRAGWPTGLGSCFVDETAAWAALRNARHLQGPLTALIARRAGVRLSLMIPAGPAGPAPAPLLMSRRSVTGH
jgi:histidine phosphotransferase ChpT